MELENGRLIYFAMMIKKDDFILTLCLSSGVKFPNLPGASFTSTGLLNFSQIPHIV